MRFLFSPSLLCYSRSKPLLLRHFPISSLRIAIPASKSSHHHHQRYREIQTDAMAELNPADKDILSQPASAEASILSKNEGREEALKQKAAESSRQAETAEEKLPPLSAADFRVYNSMAEHMEYFHNHFRQTWTTLHNACVQNRRPSNISLKAFINLGLQFISHLTAHHSIEEAHIFPILAKKMPEFRSSPSSSSSSGPGKAGSGAAELLRQHKEIHIGMDQFEEYLNQCRSGQRELVLSELKARMDCWGEVLWKHLDQEVKTLGADNMRRYWTVGEMRRMPM